MAIKEIKREWSPEQLGFVRTFLLHKEKDVKDLPSCCTGSVATVSETDNEYICTPDGWKLRTECAEGSGIDAKVAKNAENIAKTGFAEKNAHFEVPLVENYSLIVDKVQPPAHEIIIPDGVKLEKGMKMLLKLTPSGSASYGNSMHVAEEAVEVVAECYLVTDYASLGRTDYAFHTEERLYLHHNVDAPDTKYNEFLFFTIEHYRDGKYKIKPTFATSNPRNFNRYTGDLVLNASVAFYAPASAYDGLTLWSSTEGSTKRFELNVDDSANATLTDVDTGESKGLGGGAGGSGGKTLIIKGSDFDNSVAGIAVAASAPEETYTANMTFDEALMAFVKCEPIEGFVFIGGSYPKWEKVTSLMLNTSDYDYPVLFVSCNYGTLLWTPEGISFT